MKTKLVAFGLATALTLFWAGTKTGFASTHGHVRKEIHQTYPMAENGRLEVDNVNGKIEVKAWERNEIEVLAVKKADTEADLDRVEVEFVSAPDRLQIHTRYPRKNWSLRKHDNSVTVDYEIKVPARLALQKVQNVNGSVEIVGVHGKLIASTVNGRLVAEGLSSDSELGSVNGSVQANFEDLTGVKNISAKTVNGRVAISLPSASDADVSAHTLNGSIRAGAELPVKKNGRVGRDLHGTLGKGGAQVKAETVNGSIEIVQANPSKQTKAEKD